MRCLYSNLQSQKLPQPSRKKLRSLRTVYITAASLGALLTSNLASSAILKPEAALSLPSGMQVGAEYVPDYESEKGLAGLLHSEDLRPYLKAGWLPWAFGALDRPTQLNIWGVEFGARWYPFQHRSSLSPLRRLFLGTGVGWRWIHLSMSLSGLDLGEGVSLEGGDIDFQSVYLPVNLGWTWYGTRSFTLSSEVGAQVSIFGWAGIAIQGGGANLFVDASPLDRIAGFMLPAVTFLRATWSLGGGESTSH